MPPWRGRFQGLPGCFGVVWRLGPMGLRVDQGPSIAELQQLHELHADFRLGGCFEGFRHDAASRTKPLLQMAGKDWGGFCKQVNASAFLVCAAEVPEKSCSPAKFQHACGVVGLLR